MTGQLTSLHTEKFPKPLISILQTHLKGGTRSSIDCLFLIQRSYQRFPVLYENQKGKKRSVRSGVKLSCHALMGTFIQADSVTAAGGHVVTFISRVIAAFYCRQALPITITRRIRLLLMSRVHV